MSDTIDSTRLQVLSAAITAAGPRLEDEDGNFENDAEYRKRVHNEVRFIVDELRDGSQTDKDIQVYSANKPFLANIVDVDFEKSSQRPKVEIEVRPSKRNPDGVETIRSLRVDDRGGRDLEKRLHKLVDHRVLVYKEMQVGKDDDSQKYRNIYDVVDLGKARDFDD